MRRRLAAVLVVAVAVGGACSDDGPGDDAATETTVTLPAEIRDFCGAFGAILGGPLFDEQIDREDPLVLQTAVEETEQQLSIAVDVAPDEARAAMQQFADGFVGAFEIYARYGYDLARVDAEATPEEQAVLDGFLAPPQGPGEPDPLVVLEDVFFGRCSAGVTLPPDVVDELSSTTTSEP